MEDNGRMVREKEKVIRKHIIGMLYYNDGSRYGGEWSNDNRNGKGTSN